MGLNCLMENNESIRNILKRKVYENVNTMENRESSLLFCSVFLQWYIR